MAGSGKHRRVDGGGGSSLRFIFVTVSSGPRECVPFASLSIRKRRTTTIITTTTTVTTATAKSRAMEDSYMVHRRRKAAARKREKTPDPSSRGAASRIDTSDDEDEERRARMERMAEEAEKVEQQQKENRLSQQQRQEVSSKEPENKDKKGDNREQRPARRKDRTDARNSANVDDMIAVRAEVAAKSAAGNSLKTRETDAIAAGNNSTQSVKQVIEGTKRFDGTTKRDVVRSEVVQALRDSVAQETSETPKETNGEIDRSVETRKVERRFKRKSKERAERYSRSTDSSDVDEKSESSQKRKSPEAIRSRMKRSSGRSRHSDPETQKKDAERQNREKRSSSRQKLEDEPQTRNDTEKPCSRPYSQTEDMDENLKTVKKNENVLRSGEERKLKRPLIEIKKQIIPLSNESLIEDFARAQREYLLRERSILDPETADVFQDEVSSLRRRRKFSLAYNESEYEEDIVQDVMQSSETADKKKSWFSRLFFWRGTKKDEDIEKKIEDEPKPIPKVEEVKVEEQQAAEKITLLDSFRTLRDIVGEFKMFVAQNPHETIIIRRLRNRCIAGLLLVMIYCGLGGFVFRFVEGAFETFYKCGVKRVKRDFLDTLWNYSHNLREDDWKSMARRKLMDFEEQLHTAHEAGLHTYSGQKSWSFLNAVVYCLTVITTIGEINCLWRNGNNFSDVKKFIFL